MLFRSKDTGLGSFPLQGFAANRMVDRPGNVLARPSALDAAPPLEGAPQRHLVDVLQIGAHRQAGGEP